MAKIPTLTDNEIHVWHIPLRQQHIDLNISLLNDTERHKAERFLFAKDRAVYAYSRIVLKQLLAQYCQCIGNDIRFDYSAHGKPFLQSEINPDNIQFNLTHSRDIALVAVAREIDLGIDIEYMREERPFLKLAKRFFTTEEYESLRIIESTQTAAQLRDSFYRCWTRKEAFIKAVGLGLAFPLNKFCVSVDETQAKLIWADENRFSGPCHLQSLPVVTSFQASLACLSPAASTKMLYWSENSLDSKD